MQEEEKEYEQKRLEKEQTEAELTEWENAKDPQPERSEAVRKNRQRLDALKIPYQEFYKAIEFGDSLTEQECNHLEEALLSMGILDALVVDASYREQVLTMEEGCEDRYLFVQKSYSGKSLLDVLELNDSMNDIFSNQRLTGILSGIAYNEESMISVSSEGIYQMGVLSGTQSSGTDQSLQRKNSGIAKQHEPVGRKKGWDCNPDAEAGAGISGFAAGYGYTYSFQDACAGAA